MMTSVSRGTLSLWLINQSEVINCFIYKGSVPKQIILIRKNVLNHLKKTEGIKQMKLTNTATIFGIACGTILSISTTVQAASFSVGVSQKTDPKADIWLQSITQNGLTFDQFNLINEAKGNILHNDMIDPTKGSLDNNTGAASTDRGDNASKPNGLEISGVKDPTMSDIATYLGNTNLNNIIDTEDDGSFEMNLFFTYLIQEDNKGLDNIFVFERGRNSDLVVQAIDAKGDLIGNYIKLEDTKNQVDLGYSIDTKEINGAQKVGGWGISLKQLGITSAAGIRIRTENGFNGPDFKMIARLNDDPILRERVPEPATLLGLGLVASSFAVSRRRKASKAC